MYSRLPHSSGDVLGFVIESRLTQEEVERMQDELGTAMEAHGSLRLLVRIDGLEDVDPSAVWQDLKMTPDYVRGIERFAVVGDERWHAWATKLGGAFADAQHFPPEEQDRAWAWVREPAGDDA